MTMSLGDVGDFGGAIDIVSRRRSLCDGRARSCGELRMHDIQKWHKISGIDGRLCGCWGGEYLGA
jgi:hypothetical protein